jgi:hypothetical protein
MWEHFKAKQLLSAAGIEARLPLYSDDLLLERSGSPELIDYCQRLQDAVNRALDDEITRHEQAIGNG